MKLLEEIKAIGDLEPGAGAGGGGRGWIMFVKWKKDRERGCNFRISGF